MIKVTDQDITMVTEGVIVQQVSCREHNSDTTESVMNHWPIIRENYLKTIKNETPKDLVNQVLKIDVDDNLTVVCIFLDSDYSNHNVQIRCPNDYFGLFYCLRMIAKEYEHRPIYIPHELGFEWGLDIYEWNAIRKMIDNVLSNCDDVTICNTNTGSDRF